MAGIVSYMSASPLVMGLFTTLNNVARCTAPILASPVVDRFPRKQRALLWFWGATVVSWAVLAAYLWTPLAPIRSVSIWVFGACYTSFFLFLGAATVAQGALLGRIIPPDRRGRAMAAGMTLSGIFNIAAILLIYRIVRSGAFPEPRSYALTFSLSVFFFLLAGGSLLFIREKEGEAQHRDIHPLESMRHFKKLALGHPGFARLIAVNVTVGVMGGMLQFYTGFWRAIGSLTPSALILATVCQVFWQSLSSSILGRLADRIGNRAIIVPLVWIEAAIPLAALGLGGWDWFRDRPGSYLFVYLLVGLRFPVYQLLVNYLLELMPSSEHAMALGAVTTAQLVTAASPFLLGGLAQACGYPACFIAGSLVGFCGAVAALRLRRVPPVSWAGS